MSKSPDAFRTISEVAEWLGIQTHVLRFWESKFSQIKPVKRAGGRRYYRPSDMLLLGGIKKLLHDDGVTIKGVQKILRENGVGHVAAMSQSLDESAAELIRDISAPPLEHAPGTVIQFSPAGTDGHAPAATDEDASAQIAMDLDQPTGSADREPPHTHRPTANPGDRPQEEDHADAAPHTDAPQDAALPRPIVVDIPNPPASDMLEVAPGVLSLLATLPELDRVQLAELAPHVHALRAWHDRATNLRGGAK